MTKFNVHLIYKDVFEEEAETLEEAIDRVKECWNDGHDQNMLGNKPEIFGYQI
jgi:hypothetical protein